MCYCNRHWIHPHNGDVSSQWRHGDMSSQWGLLSADNSDIILRDKGYTHVNSVCQWLKLCSKSDVVEDNRIVFAIYWCVCGWPCLREVTRAHTHLHFRHRVIICSLITSSKEQDECSVSLLVCQTSLLASGQFHHLSCKKLLCG